MKLLNAMKAIIIVPLAILWLALSGGYLYLVSTIKMDEPQHFKSDNIAVTFTYPANWKVDLQGDLSDTSSDKLITLTDPDAQFSIMLRQSFVKPSSNECAKYNDCQFVEPVRYFSFIANDFEPLNTIHSIYASKKGGVDFFYDNQGNINLLESDMVIGNSYEIYQKNESGKFSSTIKLQDSVTVQIDYQVDSQAGLKNFIDEKAVIKLILDSLNW